jgi:Circularly permutated YpsA SLOG family
VVEVLTTLYPVRTRKNIEESDGAVIFSLEHLLSGGTKLTREHANKLRKPGAAYLWHSQRANIDMARKAEALNLADRNSEALEAISEAEALIEGFEQRFWRAELYRLRRVFLANLGADEAQIEASLREAISTAKEQ